MLSVTRGQPVRVRECGWFSVPGAASLRRAAAVRRALAVIAESQDPTLKPGEVAHAVRLNHTYLARAIRAATDVLAYDSVTRRRVYVESS